MKLLKTIAWWKELVFKLPSKSWINYSKTYGNFYLYLNGCNIDPIYQGQPWLARAYNGYRYTSWRSHNGIPLEKVKWEDINPGKIAKWAIVEYAKKHDLINVQLYDESLWTGKHVIDGIPFIITFDMVTEKDSWRTSFRTTDSSGN